MLENNKKELEFSQRPCLHPKLQTSLVAFLNSHPSSLTQRSYTHTVGEFLTFFFQMSRNLQDLSRDHLILYQKKLQLEEKAPKTILKKMAALSSLCKHLAHEGLVQKDLSFGLKRPRSENKKETADLSEDEVRRLFNALDPRQKAYTSHRALLALGFYTGLRSAEIRRLKIGHLAEIKGHRLLVLTIKGRKPHEIPLNPFAYRCLLEHLNTLETLGLNTKDPNQWFFPSLRPFRNQPLSPTALSKIFKGLLRKAGISCSHARRYSPHSMRATLAGHLLNVVEAPLEQVQRVLGHASPTTTLKYNKREQNHDKNPVYKISY